MIDNYNFISSVSQQIYLTHPSMEQMHYSRAPKALYSLPLTFVTFVALSFNEVQYRPYFQLLRRTTRCRR